MSGTDRRLSASDYVVLYVDDEADNRVVFQHSFSRRFVVETCESGEAALARLERGPVAVLLTDQRMTGISGNELLRLARDRSPDTVGVVITAYDNVEPILEAYNHHLASRYIIKPWTAREVETVIAWGIEVYALAHQKSELEMKLLQGERLTTLGTMSAGVVHDLNQPLAILKSNLDVIESHLPSLATVMAQAMSSKLLTAIEHEGLKIDLPEALADALVATQQLRATTESVLRFLSPGKDAGPTMGDPAMAVRYAVTLCRPRVVAHGGLFRQRADAELPTVNITTSALTQVIVNLVVNAAQALVTGKKHSVVDLRVEAVSALPEEKDPASGGIRIVVRDNGSGMSPEVLARASELFFTTKPSGAGSGLGLSNTQRLVKEARGKLVMESVAGEGTTVTVWIPRSS